MCIYIWKYHPAYLTLAAVLWLTQSNTLAVLQYAQKKWVP